MFTFALLAACGVNGTTSAQPASLIDDGGVEGRSLCLNLGAGCSIDRGTAHSGSRSLRVQLAEPPGGVTSGGGAWLVEDFEPGKTYTVSVWLKTADIVPNAGRAGYGYVAMYQYDQFNDYVSFHDFVQPRGTGDWERHTYTFQVGAETVRLEIPFGLFQASGTLWVDDFTLVEGPQALDLAEVAQPAQAAAGARPGIAILKDDLPVVGVGTEPDYLKEILDRLPGRPYEATLISAAQLADRRFLTPQRFDLVILPYGETFPAPAAEAFRRYLRGGGDMITLGGYAFNNLVGLEAPEAGPAPPEECSWHYKIPITPEMGTRLTFEGHLRCRGVVGPGMAYLAVYQHAADHKLLAWKDTIHLVGDRDWTESQYGFEVAEGAAYLDVKVGLYRCTGTASFDDISLKDEQGRELIGDPGFEQVTDPDRVRDHAWYRTREDLATIVTGLPRSGERCARVRLAAAEERPLAMNTARGQPADGLQVSPDQIGVFDAQFPLKRVDHAAAAPNQFVVPGNFVADAPMEGWSAVTVLGYDEARRIPLLECVDRYGRLRGSAASLTYRYGGRYARSAWVVFGSTDFDFMPRDAPASEQLLVPIVKALVTETFLHNLETEFACYRQGETVKVRGKVSNLGAAPQTAIIQIFAEPEGRGKGVWLEPPAPLVLQPDETQEFATEWRPGKFGAAFYRVEARLSLAPEPPGDTEGQVSTATEAREWDRMETGFCVWDEEVVKSGPDCVLKDNLFRLNGREHFLQGTDNFSVTFGSAHENPLVWKRDFQTMRDQGMNLPENLQVSAVGQPTPYEWPEKLLRQTDAMVQLAQQYGQVYMPGLLIGANVVVEDDVLEKEAAWVQAFVKRYKDVPGILWYINGDFQLRLADNVNLANQRGGEVPRTDVERLWNEFLQRRYGTDAALQDAWGAGRVTGALGKVPLEDWGSADWDDMRAVDMAAFKVELMRRWINRHVRAIREVDPHHAITSEYYQAPSAGIDIVWAIGDHACANIGYFDRPQADIQRFPSALHFADLRERGKSMSAGEFGCKTHPAWGDGRDHGYHITRTPAQQEELWLAITHYGWGLGASKIHNWDWKDTVEWVFPWGMVYPGDWVKKDCLDIYRATGLTFRQFERRYEPTAVCVLTPDSHRLGAPVWTVHEATLACFNTLQYLGVGVTTLNDCALEAIPASAKAVFYPIPYQIPDAAYAKLLDWVKAGGTLYVSGDVSYDMLRRRTLTQRLSELCGVELVAERYPNVACPADTGLPAAIAGQEVTVNPALVVKPTTGQVLVAAEDEAGTPIIVRHDLGRGRVIFSTWPLERDQGFAEGIAERNGRVYRLVLEAAGVPPAAEGGPQLPVRVTLAGREAHADVWVNPTGEPVAARTAPGDPAISLPPHRSGLAVRGGNGELLALEDGRGAHYMAYSLDGRDVRDSTQVCLLPLGQGLAALPTRAAWSSPVAVVGEVKGGEWVTYERVPVRARGGALEVEIDQDRCFSIVVIAEESAAGDCTSRVVRSLNEPWRMQ